MNLKNIKVLKSIAALSLAAMMSLSGVCAFADTTEPSTEATQKSPLVFYTKNLTDYPTIRETFYYDDFEWMGTSDNAVWTFANNSMFGKNGEPAYNAKAASLWDTYGSEKRKQITKEDGNDLCLTLLPQGSGNNANIFCKAVSSNDYQHMWNQLECRFRLTGGTASIELNANGTGKLIKIDQNGITVFPDNSSESSIVTGTADSAAYNKWYTLKIGFAYPNTGRAYSNKYEMTVLDDNGATLFRKDGSNFSNAAHNSTIAYTPTFYFMCSGNTGNKFNLSYIKLSSFIDKGTTYVHDISDPSVTTNTEDETVTTSYDFTNLKFDETTKGIPLLSGAVLSVNSDNGKNDCQSGSFETKTKGSEVGTNEVISQNFNFHKDNNLNVIIDSSNVGAVSGRLSATVEGTTANVNTYLLDSLDGLRLHGMTNQKSASITKAQENDNGTVTINGTADNYAKDDKVLLYIIKNGTTLSNIDTDNSKKSDLVYVKEVTPNSSTGAFTAELTPDFAGGAYNVGIGGSHKADTETPLNVSGISLNVKSGDKDINKLTDIEDGTADVSVTAAFGNKDELDKSMMCVATYKDGVLTGIKMGVVDSTTKTLSTTFKKGGSDRAAIFIWNKTTYAPYKFKDIK